MKIPAAVPSGWSDCRYFYEAFIKASLAAMITSMNKERKSIL
jgi:hypothetical protein